MPICDTTAFENRYDQFAAAYDRAHARWLRYAGAEAQCAFDGAAAALLRPGASVLDAACGAGAVSRRLLADGPPLGETTLLDSSPAMLARCADLPGRRVQARLEAMPLPSNHYDLVACAWGLETVAAPEAALAECLRVARPGGRICLVFCADRNSWSAAAWALRWRIAATGRGRFLAPDAVATVALRLGARHAQRLRCSGPAAAMILHR